MAPRTFSLQISAILFYLLAVFASPGLLLWLFAKAGHGPTLSGQRSTPTALPRGKAARITSVPLNSHRVFGATKECTKVLSCR